ncbi:hypothetical protein [Candidatus Paracaedibacter symbiosus]|uniref:hypothetical protein n=1 Tax=Candidatus Paracaedibacter symbiosus TaxID=244582 RepID=UPI000509C0C3|nr:hypothetical protein [Candidatus Paracaedibacter symbiosus]
MSLLSSLIPHIVHSFMANREKPRDLWLHSLGVVMVISGFVMGSYFLFQFLSPVIGYLESGLVFSGVFLIFGLGLLSIKSRTKPQPGKEILLTANNIIEHLNIPFSFEKHAGKLILGTICLGVLLAQVLGKKH